MGRCQAAILFCLGLPLQCMVSQLLGRLVRLRSLSAFCGGGSMTRCLAVPAGHYVSFVKSHDKWLFFDDESVEAISESLVQTAFGSPQEYNSSSMDHGYILMFTRQSVDSSSSSSTPVSATAGAP